MTDYLTVKSRSRFRLIVAVLVLTGFAATVAYLTIQSTKDKALIKKIIFAYMDYQYGGSNIVLPDGTPADQQVWLKITTLLTIFEGEVERSVTEHPDASASIKARVLAIEDAAKHNRLLIDDVIGQSSKNMPIEKKRELSQANLDLEQLIAGLPEYKSLREDWFKQRNLID